MEHFCEKKEQKKKVAFLTLGCKVNSYETNAMEQLFVEAGYQLVDFQKEADIYVINTCTVTNMADRKSRQMLHKAKKLNPNGVIVAVGCYVQASFEEAKKDEAIDVIIGNNQKKQIVSIVEEYQKVKIQKEDKNRVNKEIQNKTEEHQAIHNEVIQHESIQNKKENKELQKVEMGQSKDNVELEKAEFNSLLDMRKIQEYEELSIENAGEKTRAYIKIQDGCNQFCSYCIIPYVRGRIRSRNEDDILSEVKRLAERGYKEVVLTGIHLSSYGVDLEGEKNFVALEGKPLLSIIKKVSEVPSIERIRLGSLEPRIVTENFAEQLAKIKKVCPHFHLSLQSGCDETLKRMNRKYTSKEYKKGCDILRKYFENPAITTDVIVGFPEETNEEFEITKAFLKEIAFSDVHIFKYSMRKGTVAAKNPKQVSESVKQERSSQLIALGKEMQYAYEQLFIGKREKVLIEETIAIEGKEYFVGHNERYVKLVIEKQAEQEELHNEIVVVHVVESIGENMLLGKYVDVNSV